MDKAKTFVFNLEWVEVLKDYPAEVRYEVYDAIMWYAASGTLPELKPLAKMAFSFIKKEMDYNRSRYDTIVERRREAGRRGAEATNSKRVSNPANAESAEDEAANLGKPRQTSANPANAESA
ncbi:MAG: hypothetical protein K2K69_06960, partial [Muribaculaceae bacterium]|nr:hypothetical protein [Muribaculaceae bacterium]